MNHRNERMSYLKIAVFWLATIYCATMLTLSVNAMSLPDKTNRDSPKSIKKRSLKGSQIYLTFHKGIRDFIFNGNTVKNIPAFFATLTSGDIGPSYANDAIKFNDVSINVGNAYNPSTGKFTAPVDGIYQLTYSYLQKSGYKSYVLLMKNGVNYSELHANHKNYDQLSKTVLIRLKKGQKAWVRLYNGSSYAVYGQQRYTTFGGYLISM